MHSHLKNGKRKLWFRKRWKKRKRNKKAKQRKRRKKGETSCLTSYHRPDCVNETVSCKNPHYISTFLGIPHFDVLPSLLSLFKSEHWWNSNLNQCLSQHVIISGDFNDHVVALLNSDNPTQFAGFLVIIKSDMFVKLQFTVF